MIRPVARSVFESVRAVSACLLLAGAPNAFAAVAVPVDSAAIRGALLVQAQAGERVFPAVGVVTGKNPNGSLTINHQDIEGLMSAMEMTFNVKPRTLSSTVRPGDKVEFGVEGKTFTIVSLKVVGHVK